MRLECSVFVGLRRLNGDCKYGRPSRGYLGLGRGTSLKDGDQTHFFLLIQHRNKKAEKFKISRDSVQAVMESQIKAGKITILLNIPAVNIFISEADSSKLHIFVTSLHQILNNNKLDERRRIQTWEASCSRSEIASSQIRRMHIVKRADYPCGSSTAFPSSLRDLKVTGIGLKSIDFRWFNLHQLKVLDLSKNRIGTMNQAIEWRKFESIRKLENLEELNLSDNKITGFTLEFYNALPTSLVTVNLSINKLKHLSEKICRLRNLRTLALNYNELVELPEDLCLLTELRSLTVSDNRLKALPSSLFVRRNQSHRRFMTLDISGNSSLLRIQRRRRLFGFQQVPSLFQLSAALLLNNFPEFKHTVYDQPLPRLVYDYMRESLRRCDVCLCLFSRCDDSNMSDFISVEMGDFSDVYSGPSFLHIERFCCVKCFK